MAIQGPIGKENLEIMFRLRSKAQLFDPSVNPLQNANCSTVASATCGLVFTASSRPELNVVCLRDLERDKATELMPPSRKLSLPTPARHIAVNCDSSILAVAVKLNGIPHVQFYAVQSFLTPNIQKIREIPLSTDNSDAIQLCWNPVIGPMLAVCTETGQLNMFTIKAEGIEYHGIDPNFKAKSCSWSPKGKQIVVGFANGKLVQFTPELKPARIIDCVPGIMPGPFDTIAIQWLSTFQFAAAFLGHQPGSRPILHIINAPKNSPPQYISYSEVCFSSAESRPSKIYLVHVMQWNMLIVGSANSIDVNFLRVTQPGDLPVWTQEFPNELFPPELPLTASSDESYPVGFEFDISCTGRVANDDGTAFPVMPMLHVMSTEGVLCSFYVMNMTQNYVDICSPPRPIDPNVIQSFFKVYNEVARKPAESAKTTPPNPDQGFSSPIGQSTPQVAKVQPKMTFGVPQPAVTTSAPPPVFGAPNAGGLFSLGGGIAPSFGAAQQTAVKPFSVSNPAESVAFGQAAAAVPSSMSITAVKPVTQPPLPAQPAQPLITVPPTFNPQASAAAKPEQKSATTTSEDDQIFAKMIKDEIKAFDMELASVLQKAKSVQPNIGTKEESATMRKKLEDLDALKKEATETVESLRSDVQINRLGVTEMFSMFFEAKAKLDQSKNEKSIFLHNPVSNQGNKRTIDRLINELNLNEMHLNTATQHICAQWSNYQEELKKKNKNRMHNPCLEELYRTLTQNQEIIYRLTERVAQLKSKLGIKDSINRTKKLDNTNIEKLSDSIISMSLIDQVQNENSKLTNKKLKDLRNLLENRETTVIKPKRPERPGLNSEIIREKKLQAMRSLRKPEKSTVAPTQPPMSMAPTAMPFQNNPAASSAPFSVTLSSTTPSFVKPLPEVQPAQPAKPVPSFGTSFGSISEALKATPPTGPQFGFSSPAASAVPISFGTQKTSEPPKPMFAPTATGTAFNMGVQPSFGFGSPSFGVNASKEASKPPAELPKPQNPPTVTASFNLSLGSKAATPPQPQPSKPTEKKDESKSEAPQTFTFKLPGMEKKEESAALTIKPATATTTGGSIFSSLSTEASKSFSFAPSPASAAVSKSSSAASSAVPGGGFTLSLGGSGDEKSAPLLPKPVIAASVDSSKPSSNFSFSVPSGTTISAVPLSDTKSTSVAATKPVETSFSFGSALSSVALTSTTSVPSFSFGTPSATTAASTVLNLTKSDSSTFSFATTLPSTVTPVASTTSTSSTVSLSSFSSGSTVVSAPTTTAASEVQKVTPVETSKPSDTSLQGLNICSPETKPATVSSPGNIFSSSTFATPKSDSSSIFGGNAFSSAFGSDATKVSSAASPSVFGSPAVTTAAAATTTPSIFSAQSPAVSSTPQSSAFGQATVTTTASSSPSVFNLSLGGDANKAPTASSGPFSFAKPDQSVFGSATSPPVSTAATSPFASAGSSVFGNTNSSASTGVFGSAASSTVFGTPPSISPPTSASIFGSAQTTQASFATPTSTTSVFGQPQSGGSVFGQNNNSGANGLFSQSSFTSPASPATNAFGGTSTFGSPAPANGIFGQAAQQPQQSSGSIFGGQSTFGQTATGGSGSVFGGSSTFGSTTSSPFGGSNVFGGNANAGGGFGSSTFGSPSGGNIFAQGQQATFGGGAVFGGSASFGKPSVFGQAAASPQSTQTNSMFEQLGSQQSGGNLFGGMSAPQPQQQQQQQGSFNSGFAGSAFSSWR